MFANCRLCGSPFKVGSGRRVYCSEGCSRQYHREEMRRRGQHKRESNGIVKRTACVKCNGPLNGTLATRMYCDTCRTLIRNAHRKPVIHPELTAKNREIGGDVVAALAARDRGDHSLLEALLRG